MFTKLFSTLANNKSLLFISTAIICLMNVTILVLCCMPHSEFSFEIGLDKGPIKLTFQVNRGERNTKPRLKAAHPVQSKMGSSSLSPKKDIVLKSIPRANLMMPTMRHEFEASKYKV